MTVEETRKQNKFLFQQFSSLLESVAKVDFLTQEEQDRIVQELCDRWANQ